MIRYIMVDMDSLLDTRLGVISNISQEAAYNIAMNPNYIYRDFDDWYALSGGLVTNEEVAEAYAARGGANTRKTLDASFETGLAPFIYRVLAEADVNMMDGMTRAADEIGLAINIAPYHMDFKEREALIEIMRLKYGRELNIKIVTYHIHELTLQCLADEFGMMIQYDFIEWFKYHHEAITTSLMSDFNIVRPKLFDKDPSELTLDQRRHCFNGFRAVTQHNLDIEYIDAKYFSLIDMRTKLPDEPEPAPPEPLEIVGEFRDLLRGNISASP